jgi:hypothetical protein
MSDSPWGRKAVECARVRVPIVVATVTLTLAVAGVSQGSHLFSDTAGHTMVEQRVTGDPPANGYSNLRTESPGDAYVVRDSAEDPALPAAQPGRESRRRSLAYMGQFTDFQLADEESPARVEFLDPGANSAWRPQEALAPFIVEWSVRQMNLFTGASPVPQGDGTRAPMDFALVTGDQADSMQRNENVWVRELLEGGRPLDFNSGSTDPNDYDSAEHPSCANFPPSSANRAEALRYTGVQDYDDYDESQTPLYYDPDEPRGSWAADGWPSYTGLMDRAQEIVITPEGLDVPSYVTNGNHDVLVQGNEDANEQFEDIATGCLKVLASTTTPGPGILDPTVLLAPAAAATLVPPDPERRYASKPQVKQIYGEHGRDNAHGFDFVDSAEEAASNGSASYYAWDPPEAPGFRFISIDTNSEGGQTAEGVGCGSASGNIDDPQFQWLKGELDTATAQDKLIVVFGHHPVRSMCAEIVDEQAPPCTGPQHDHGDTPEHDHNPGCDLDPRVSEPIHLGEDPAPGDPRESFVELLDQYRHVIGYVAGHTHENNIDPFVRSDGSVWWGIETSATADWPVQHRLIEVFDNRDGTLSIFGTILDHAAAATAPPSGSASGFDSETLAAIGRVFTYNDPQVGPGPTGGQGSLTDRNVELLVQDPRTRFPRPGGGTPFRVPLIPEFEQCTTLTQNSNHVAPLASDACSPPLLDSSVLTTSTTGRGVGSARFDVVNGNPSTPEDEADVRINASATDVQRAIDGSDHTGSVILSTLIRITDNASGASQNVSATVIDTEFSAPFGCAATPDPTLGATCSLDTTADTLVPGFTREGERTIVSLRSLTLEDPGPDGLVDIGIGCPPTCGSGDERVFLRQGVFTP